MLEAAVLKGGRSVLWRRRAQGHGGGGLRATAAVCPGRRMLETAAAG